MAESRNTHQENSFSKLMSKLNLSKKPSTSSAGENDHLYYKISHPVKGLAVIFSHENFTTPAVKPREGTHMDCAELENTFFGLGFDVVIHRDLTFREIEIELEKVSSYDFVEYDCLLITVLSHGEQNVIFASDTKYSTNILFKNFTRDQCPSLTGKPKIYLIQACQGHKLDDGIDVEVDSPYEPRNNRECYVPFHIQWHPDYLIAYSTVAGHVSWRHPNRGSWFIQLLCLEITNHWLDHDLVTILSFVSRKIAHGHETHVPSEPMMHGKKQATCVHSMLTKLVRFGMRNGK